MRKHVVTMGFLLLALGMSIAFVSLQRKPGQPVISSVGASVEIGSKYAVPPTQQVVATTASARPKSSRSSWADDAKETQIGFSDGSAVSAQLRLLTPDAPAILNPTNLASAFDELLYSASAGDAGSARALFMSLDFCRQAFRNEADLNAAIARLHSDGTLTFPDNARPDEHIPTGVDTTEYEKQLRSSYSYCNGITEEQLSQSSIWAEAAAVYGDLAGINRWSREIDNTPAEVELWKKAWEHGFQTAAQRLAIIYRDGVPSDGGMGPPDAIKAYAYQLVAFKLNAAAYAEQDASMMATMDNVLAEFGSTLNPQQQQVAERMAVDLLKSNDNCCIVGMLSE